MKSNQGKKIGTLLSGLLSLVFCGYFIYYFVTNIQMQGVQYLKSHGLMNIIVILLCISGTSSFFRMFNKENRQGRNEQAYFSEEYNKRKQKKADEELYRLGVKKKYDSMAKEIYYFHLKSSIAALVILGILYIFVRILNHSTDGVVVTVGPSPKVLLYAILFMAIVIVGGSVLGIPLLRLKWQSKKSGVDYNKLSREYMLGRSFYLGGGIINISPSYIVYTNVGKVFLVCNEQILYVAKQIRIEKNSAYGINSQSKKCEFLVVKRNGETFAVSGSDEEINRMLDECSKNYIEIK